MAHLSIRGLDDRTALMLREAARKRGRSVNAEVVSLLREGLGLARPGSGAGGHTDLDHLSGSWTEKEAREVTRRLGAFEAVDEELWR